MLKVDQLAALQAQFGEKIQRNVPLAGFTAARVGGNADVLFTVGSALELEEAVQYLWANKIRFTILGGGSNVLVSDAGVRGVVVFNRAKEVKFDLDSEEPTVWAESGASFGLIARLAARQNLSGLEWAAGIPGTVGGAVVGNAGAFDGDMAGNLVLAEILQHKRGKEVWTADDFKFSYRNSVLKSAPGTAVVLSVQMQLSNDSPERIGAKMGQFQARRRATQPPGASMGSMFKNPPGDFAGRLIEEAGLKGTQVGDVIVSPVHGNFFVNMSGSRAEDICSLVQIVQETVYRNSGVRLELEVELMGDWPTPQSISEFSTTGSQGKIE